jgi:hypothetical protein
MSTNKPKVIKDFEKLTIEMQEAVENLYPDGYHDFLVKFADKDGKYIHAIPYETEDRYYLIKLPKLVAPKVVKVAASEKDEESPFGGGDENPDDADGSSYADLDTMRIGGNKPDDNDDYD